MGMIMLVVPMAMAVTAVIVMAVIRHFLLGEKMIFERSRE